MRELIISSPEQCIYRNKGQKYYFCNHNKMTNYVAYCQNFTDDDGFPTTCPLKKVE